MGIKFPTLWKTLIIKFPPPQDGKGVKCLGYAGGGGMLKLWFDRYISSLLAAELVKIELKLIKTLLQTENEGRLGFEL